MKELKKEKGSIEIVCCLFLIVMVSIILFAFYEIREIKVAANYVEDGLSLSGLAGALFDEDEASIRGVLIIDKEECYEAFLRSLKVNLNLSDNLNSKDGLYYSKIDVERYIVYDVLDDVVIVTEYSDTGSYSSKELQLGKAHSPNGSEITKTCIYIKLGVYMKGFLQTDDVYQTIDKIVGIRGN